MSAGVAGDSTGGESAGSDELPAGPFSAWLRATIAAIDGESPAEVPCGDCTACCTASQFVHIAPDEVDALAHIPSALLFPAPMMPAGHVLLGYDERGHCPMLVDGRCSIYEHRPRTCRTYDCRVFAAAGIEPDEPEKAAVAQRVRRWRFEHPGAADLAEHEAVRTAAAYLAAPPDPELSEPLPVTATQRAVLAVELHATFLDRADPPAHEVAVALRRRRPGVSR